MDNLDHDLAKMSTRLLVQRSEPHPLGRITLAGFIRDSRGIQSEQLRVLDGYALVYTVEGAGQYEDAHGTRFSFGAGDLMLVLPGVPHRYGPVGHHRWSELYIVFDGPIFDLWQQAGALPPASQMFHAQPVAFWYQRLRSVIELSRTQPPEWQLLEVTRLQQVLADVLAMRQQRSLPDPDLQWLARARTHMDALPLDQRDAAETVARRMGLTSEQFRKKFTRLDGRPPARYVAQRVIQHACDLLQHSPMTNSQLARICGFHDEFHFSRRFKQIVGTSPRQFRERLPQPRRDGGG